jgi:para-nitrobenzyl esterase
LIEWLGGVVSRIGSHFGLAGTDNQNVWETFMFKGNASISIRVVYSLAALAVIFSFNHTALAADPIKLDSGLISGEALGDGIDVYRGVPFAAPPVGELRWKPPHPVEPWEGVRESVEFSAVGPQANTLGQFTGDTLPETSEDMLYLNVWTPAGGTDEKLPVMVWIHGGVFTLGWGHQKGYDGVEFAKRGVVLVSVNYRLGPFGFMSHPALSAESDQGVSGNYGFLDQVAALQWVERNISKFGGDPDNVTIFGESAGGTSVAALSASPQTKGLVNRAIAQSPWINEANETYLKKSTPFQKSAEAIGEDWAAAVFGSEISPTVEQMRALSTEEVMAQAEIAVPVAVIDDWFLNGTVGEVFDAGEQNPISMMVGSNRDEGTMFLMMFPVRTVAEYEATMKDTYGDAAEEILKLYPVTSDKEVRGAMNKFITDTWFTRAVREMAAGQSHVGKESYQYEFTRVSRQMPAWGAHHAAELGYVFNTLPEQGLEEADRSLADAMIKYWVQFAKTGNPNQSGLPNWPAFAPGAEKYLELGDEIVEKAKLRSETNQKIEEVREILFDKHSKK